MDKLKLKPCPFCSGEALVVKVKLCENPYVVVCQSEKCGASIGVYSGTREAAVEAWNRRGE